MRVLLDECVPRPIMRELPGHEVRTVVDMGWAGKRNGELLALMAPAGLSVFVTVDQNFSYQQNLRNAGIAVVLMKATSNRLSDLLPMMPAVRAAVARRMLASCSRSAGKPVFVRCTALVPIDAGTIAPSHARRNMPPRASL